MFVKVKGLLRPVHLTRTDLEPLLGARRIARQVKSWIWTKFSTKSHHLWEEEQPVKKTLTHPWATERENNQILYYQ